ncbi:MAG: glycine oxidase ThiO [Alphaproteobacteria bacterium]
MSKNIAIIGAGIAGLTTAYRFARAGWSVSIFEKGDDSLRHGCSFQAGGMIAPYCELISAEQIICDLGLESLALWEKEYAPALPDPFFIDQKGSLVVAHKHDLRDLDFFEEKIKSMNLGDAVEVLDHTGMRHVEPKLAERFSKGLFFKKEAQVNPRFTLWSLRNALLKMGAKIHYACEVENIEPRQFSIDGENFTFDWVADCRGLGAREDLKTLRGVRGEIIVLQTQDRTTPKLFERPIRMLHPRYPLYIIPRGCSRYIVGATSIENESLNQITVKSSLELLSAAYALHPRFAEFTVTENAVQLRPAFDDNLPKIQHQEGLIRINGLYRHGFLLSPKMADLAFNLIENEEKPAEFKTVFEETI